MKDLERLTAIADELERLDTRREQLFSERMAIWLRLRDNGLKQAEIAKPSRVSEGAVTQAFRKVRLSEAST